jgi:hypothetical protein
MNNIRTLSVTFAEEIHPDSLVYFRDAILKKVGSDQLNKDIWMSDAPGRYALIQYQLDRRRPKLLFLNAAIGILSLMGKFTTQKLLPLKLRSLLLGILRGNGISITCAAGLL